MEEEMIGLYARTNTGKIFRFAWVENEKYILIITKSEYGYLKYEKYWLEKDEEIVKHSKNIIDLILVGDYVNGKEVHKYNGNTGIVSINELGWTFIAFKDKKYPIETIVTREQFASMEYKVGE